ncbi:hypothetical protein PEC18_34970 [Paucibacter sp. O1-1]|nr:hypothetical protein [Paucibacter sp. O1-1]MDA3830879.1 hypothetical protein [Paucibacter sp. O1-1]
MSELTSTMTRRPSLEAEVKLTLSPGKRCMVLASSFASVAFLSSRLMARRPGIERTPKLPRPSKRGASASTSDSPRHTGPKSGAFADQVHSACGSPARLQRK